jgi:hypothetical protein
MYLHNLQSLFLMPTLPVPDVRADWQKGEVLNKLIIKLQSQK